MSKQPPLPRSIIAALPASFEIAKLLHQARVLLDGQLQAELNEAESKGPMDVARAFVAFHRLNDKFKDFSKAFSASFETVKGATIPENFEESGVKNAPLSEGYRVDTSLKLQCAIWAGKLPDAIKYCRDNGMPNIIAESINAQTLSSAMANEIKETSKEPPRLIFNIHYKPSSKVTLVKSKVKTELDDTGDL